MKEERVIKKFLEKYNFYQADLFALSEKPDKNNREKKDIDAIFTSQNGYSIALEHTQVSSFSNQNWDSANLSDAIKSQVDILYLHGIRLLLPTPIPSNPDWQNDLSKIVAWLKINLSNIPLGLSTNDIHDVPFRVSVFNDGLIEPFSIGRFCPATSDARKSLVDSMLDALVHMEGKLQSTPRFGHTTILLLELNEIGIGTTSFSDRYRSWLLAEKSFTGFIPDQAWLAVTHESSDHSSFLCFKGPNGLMQKANPSQFRYGDSQYWNSVLTSGPI